MLFDSKHYQSWIFFTILLTAFSNAIAQSSIASSKERSARVAPDLSRFLPKEAVLTKQLDVDFENDGVPERVFVYTTRDRSDAVFHNEVIKVLKYNGRVWSVAYKSTAAKYGYYDYINLELLRSAGGKEGVLAIASFSGAGTATFWNSLASVKNNIVVLDPTRVRSKVLSKRGYADNGYNGVVGKDDLIVENLAGYSLHRARCCPDRPSLEITFRFTGESIELKAVRQLSDNPSQN